MALFTVVSETSVPRIWGSRIPWICPVMPSPAAIPTVRAMDQRDSQEILGIQRASMIRPKAAGISMIQRSAPCSEMNFSISSGLTSK